MIHETTGTLIHQYRGDADHKNFKEEALDDQSARKCSISSESAESFHDSCLDVNNSIYFKSF
jgi:hypothetical protein